MKAARILTLISASLQDLEPGLEKRWPWELKPGECCGQRATLLDFINAALLDIALQRPDLTAVTEPICLEPGIRQWIPSRKRHCATHDAIMFFCLIRNLGSDGATPGSHIAPTVPDLILAWANAGKCGKCVENFAYDRSTDPKTYLVFPAVPQNGEVWVEASYSARPNEIRCIDDELKVDETCASAIQHHVLASIMSGDNESANYQKALYHWQLYNSLMGIKTATDMNWPKAKNSYGQDA